VLAAILSSSLRRPAARALTWAAAAVIALLIGLSRIYLGVHYPTDVLAGYAVAVVWVAAVDAVAREFRRRRSLSSITR
jgi:undecaprenyl-diphosphatase